MAKYFVPVVTLVSLGTFVVWSAAYAAGVVPRQWYQQAGSPYLFAFFFALVSVLLDDLRFIFILLCVCL